MQMPQPSASVIGRKDQIVARLSEVLPRDAVISDERETRAYECDALTAYKCPPLCAVLPATTKEVSDVLRICHEMGVPVVPRGSGTSLAGGALPTEDSVIIGVARMGEVLEFNTTEMDPKGQMRTMKARIVSPVFYDPDGEKQDV